MSQGPQMHFYNGHFRFTSVFLLHFVNATRGDIQGYNILSLFIYRWHKMMLRKSWEYISLSKCHLCSNKMLVDDTVSVRMSHLWYMSHVLKLIFHQIGFTSIKNKKCRSQVCFGDTMVKNSLNIWLICGSGFYPVFCVKVKEKPTDVNLIEQTLVSWSLIVRMSLF